MNTARENFTDIGDYNIYFEKNRKAKFWQYYGYLHKKSDPDACPSKQEKIYVYCGLCFLQGVIHGYKRLSTTLNMYKHLNNVHSILLLIVTLILNFLD